MDIHARSHRFISASIFSRIRTLIFDSQCQRTNHTLAGDGEKVPVDVETSADSTKTSGCDTSTWKAVDSRVFGIRRHMIPTSSWIVLKRLRNEGFDTYLVGGCVRDLLLKRTPKDFDVITTAKLKQINKLFYRSRIVGRRFPICWVNIKGSIIEVSSFDTIVRHDKGNDSIPFSKMRHGFDEKDFVRWKNCMDRDFTINSLFYDPFVDKIYDYTNGIRDLRLRKVKTVSPAQLSFKEDCARILRGLRIAARLGLTFSKETAVAIRNLHLSIMDLNKTRLMMELNFMLSYGAAEASLHLLKRFKLLETLLPVHAAYLNQQTHNESSFMLLKLFSCVDKLLACDRPSDCSLWVGLLAFHLALANNPQDALVIWAFSSILYHGQWREAVEFAREQAKIPVCFLPEISEACLTKSDEELAEEVVCFASHVKSSINALTETESLHKSMDKYPLFPCPGVVFISKKVGQTVAELFNVLLHDIESYTNKRENFEIDYSLLGKGNVDETRFVIGKVIMDTLSSGIVQEQKLAVVEENLLQVSLLQQRHKAGMEKHHTPSVNLGHQHREVVKKDKCGPSEPENEQQQEAVKENVHIQIHNIEGRNQVFKKKILKSNPEQQQEGVKEKKRQKTLSSLFV